jgi:hypothetical protein
MPQTREMATEFLWEKLIQYGRIGFKMVDIVKIYP